LCIASVFLPLYNGEGSGGRGVAVKALDIDKGPAHVEIKVTDQGAKIVELGARLGGDYIATDLVPLSTGFSMVEAAVLCAGRACARIQDPEALCGHSLFSV